MRFAKPLKVGKVERYQLSGPNLKEWLDGELLTGATVTLGAEAAIVGAPDFAAGVIGFYATGITAGRCEAHFNYQTATRSDCYSAEIVVLEC